MDSPEIIDAPSGRPKVPNHPFDRRWYAHLGGKTQGPHTGHDIRRMVERGEVVATDLVYAEGGQRGCS